MINNINYGSIDDKNQMDDFELTKRNTNTNTNKTNISNIQISTSTHTNTNFDRIPTEEEFLLPKRMRNDSKDLGYLKKSNLHNMCQSSSNDAEILDANPLYAYEHEEKDVILNIYTNTDNHKDNESLLKGNSSSDLEKLNGNISINTINPIEADAGIKIDLNLNYVSIVSNTMNGLLGVSIFAIPWGFAMSGLIGGIIIVLTVSWLAFETVRILLIAQKALYRTTGTVYTYPELAVELLNNQIWSPVVKCATIVSCLGCCTSYIIFFNDLYVQLFDVSHLQATLTVGVPLILLSWIRTYKELAIFTLIGVCSIITSVFVIVWDGYMHYHEQNSDHTGSNSSDASSDTTPLLVLPLLLPHTMMQFVGPATFIFTLHYCILAMGSEMLLQQPWLVIQCGTEDIEGGGVDTGLQVTAPNPLEPVSEINIEIPADQSSGPVLSEELLSVYQSNNYNIIINRSRSNTGASVVLTDHAQDHIISPHIGHHHFVSHNGGSHMSNSYAHAMPVFEPIEENSSTSSPVEIPSEVVVKDNLGPGLTVAYVASVCIICFLGIFGYATYRFSDLVRDEHGAVVPGCENIICQNIILNVHPGVPRNIIGVSLCIGIVLGYAIMLIPAREHIEPWVVHSVCGMDSSTSTFRRKWTKNIVRTVLVGFTLYIAVEEPYFGTALGTVGGLTDALQAFVLPPLIYLRLHRNQQLLNTREIVLYICICIWGVYTIVYTLYNILLTFTTHTPVLPPV